ncbi:MAG: DUF924 family protein [Pseudomonadota bacterium]
MLDFWFGPAVEDASAAEARNALWFRKSFETDAKIAERFLDTLAALAGGLCYDWAVRSARGRLAAIVALDQFTRNIFRDMPAAFAHDTIARDLAHHGLMIAVDHDLTEIERKFFYLPFEHSEDAGDQEIAVKAMVSARNAARPGYEAILDDAVEYAERHKQVIDQFGRFPHRNQILGRTTTPEEASWLMDRGGF